MKLSRVRVSFYFDRWELFRLGLVGFLILASCVGIWAAINRGSIRGNVSDPQGAVMPHVAVTITNTDTGVQTSGHTDSAGFYLFPELVPGNYNVHIEEKGFVPADVTKIVVRPNEVSTVDMQLKLGATAQRIEVIATNPLVETAPTNVGTGVAERYVEDLPILGRDTQALVNLVPGVTSTVGPPGSLVGFNGGQFGGFPDGTHIVGSYLSANGGQAGSSEWYLDGNLNSAQGQNNMVVDPPPDALAEFQTINTNFAAEYGRVEGAVFSQVLKSGSNNLHGDLYGYNRNSYFSARNPMAAPLPNGAAAPPNFVNWNQFGGTIGGPIYIPHVYNGKNKTFFFAAWDISLLHELGPWLGSIPTALECTGNFSEFPIANEYGIYDPLTTTYNSSLGVFQRQPFLNPNGTLASSLPANRLDPVAMWYVNQYPAPNFLDPRQQNAAAGGCLNTCNNFESTYGDSQTSHTVVAKVDHEISANDKLFVEWLFNPTYYRFMRLPWTGATAPLTGFNGTFPYNIKNQLATLGETHVFSPTLVNEFRFTYSRQFAQTLPEPPALTNETGVTSELAGLNIKLFPPLQPVPIVYVGSSGTTTSYAGFGSPVNNMTFPISAATVLDNITKVWGKHTVKAGFMFRVDQVGTEFPTESILNFAGGLVDNPTTGFGGNAFAQMELGAVDQSSYYRYLETTLSETRYYSWYLQDDYRVSPKLTLNFGVRWDMYAWWEDRYNNPGLMLPNTPNPDDPSRLGAIVYMESPQHPSRRPYPANHNDFAPRLNFSYSPFANGKTVIRGGYDLMYADDVSNVDGPALGPNESVGTTPAPNFSGFDTTGRGLIATNQAPAFILSQGAPSLGPVPGIDYSAKARDLQWTGTGGAGLGGGFFTYLPLSHDPYVQVVNLQVQHELPGNLVISVGYVGSFGRHILNQGINGNYVHTATKLQYKSQLNDLVTMPADLVADGFPTMYPMSQLYKPFPQYTGVSWYGTAFSNSEYNGLQMKVEKRFSHGFNFLAAYSAQKTIDDAYLASFVSNLWIGVDGWANGRGRVTATTFANGSPQDPDNIRGDRHLAVDDTPQILNTAFSYTLPFGPGRAFAGNAKGVARHIVQGWKITGNFNAQSGIPLDITGPGNSLTSRVNLIGNPNAGRSAKTRYQEQQQYFNPNAFEAVFGSDPTAIGLATTGTPAQKDAYQENGSYPFWRFGTANAYLGDARAPGFWNMDASLGKDFIISEAKRLEFRANTFNTFNHQNLGYPNTNWCLGPNADGSTDAVHQFGCQFGRITTVQTDPRAWQFSLKLIF